MVQPMSGLMSLTGDPDGPPYRAGISVFDVMTGLHAAIGILAALNDRTKTGRGQHVEASLLASNTVAQGVAFTAEIGLDPVVLTGQGAGAIPTIQHPLDFPASPPRCDLPPPGLDENGSQIREWLTTGVTT